MAKIIDGKAVSAAVKERVRDDIARDGLDIGLAVVIVGDDPASRVYVNNKKKACEFCGIKSYEYALPQDTTEAELLELTCQAEEYIQSIEKADLRIMFRLYYIDGLPWIKVADAMNRMFPKKKVPHTEDSCRMRNNRFFDKM